MMLSLKNVFNYHFWNSFEPIRYNNYLESTFNHIKKVEDQNILQVRMNLEKDLIVFEKNKDDNEKKRKVIGNLQVIQENNDTMYTENIFGKSSFKHSNFSLYENFNVLI